MQPGCSVVFPTEQVENSSLASRIATSQAIAEIIVVQDSLYSVSHNMQTAD